MQRHRKRGEKLLGAINKYNRIIPLMKIVREIVGNNDMGSIVGNDGVENQYAVSFTGGTFFPHT